MIGLCSLFLDTPVFSAHATAVDVLYAGVPMLTLAGANMVQRGAASLLHAAGLSWLVTNTLEEYEDLAIRLAMHPEYLQQVHQYLLSNRYCCYRAEEYCSCTDLFRNILSLFNTREWITDWERSLQMLWDIYPDVAHVIVHSK